MNKSESDILKEFSPQFVANGLSGMLVSDEYEAVDVKFTFYRKAPPRETPPKKEEAQPQADNTARAEILPLLERGIQYSDANGLGSVKSIFQQIAAKLSPVA